MYFIDYFMNFHDFLPLIDSLFPQLFDYVLLLMQSGDDQVSVGLRFMPHEATESSIMPLLH